MKYENRKIVGIISTNVDATTALNVIGHLAIAIGKYSDEEIMGKKIITDKSNMEESIYCISLFLINLAGFPPTIVQGSTSLKTLAVAPTTAITLFFIFSLH